MRRAVIYWAVICVGWASAYGGERVNFPLVERVIQVKDLTLEYAEQFVRGAYPGVVLELQKGAEFPVKYLASSEIFSVKFLPQLSLRVEESLFVRFLGRKGYVSHDLEHWEKRRWLGDLAIKTQVAVDPKTSEIAVSSTLEGMEENEEMRCYF